MTEPLVWGLVAGALATFNPCGFAMLPAVLARYVARKGRESPWLEGLGVGLLLTLGTLTSFGLIGFGVSLFGAALTRFVPYLNLALAAALLTVAALTFAGRAPGLRLTSLHAPRGASLGEFYAFGAAYGLASLACSLPIFLIVVAGVAGRSPAENLAVFVAYGLGMGGVLTAVSLATALGKVAVLRALKSAGRHLQLVGGLGLLGAGTYLVYYQAGYLQLSLTGANDALPAVLAAAALGAAILTSRILRAGGVRVVCH